MRTEMWREKLHAHVEEWVRAKCTSPVRAAFLVISQDNDSYRGALAMVEKISDEDAKDIRLRKSKLREVLREYYHPSDATLTAAEIDKEFWVIFHKVNLG